eukprot:403345864
MNKIHRFKSIQRWVKKQDNFGHPITLSYKDSSTFKSVFGGIVTLLTRIGLLVYFTTAVVNVLNRSKFMITKTTQNKNQIYEPNEVTLTRDNFDVGNIITFLFNDDINATEMNKYLTVDIDEVSFAINDGVGQEIVREIPQTPCTADRFQGAFKDLDYFGLLGQGPCMEPDFNIKVKGSDNIQEGSYLRMRVKKCNQTKLSQIFPNQPDMKCKSTQEIDQVVNKILAQSVMLQQYFDEEDFKQPLKSTVNSFDHYLIDKKYVYEVYYITLQNVYLEDSYISASMGNQQFQIFSLNLEETQMREQFEEDEGTLVDINIFMSDSVKNTKRQVTTLIDAISDTGGFMSVVYTIVSILISGPQEHLFFQSIIKKLFLYNKKELESKKQTDNLKEAIMKSKNIIKILNHNDDQSQISQNKLSLSDNDKRLADNEGHHNQPIDQESKITKLNNTT